MTHHTDKPNPEYCFTQGIEQQFSGEIESKSTQHRVIGDVV